MTRSTSRFAAAFAAVLIVVATAIPVVTVPAHTPGTALAIAPILA